MIAFATGKGKVLGVKFINEIRTKIPHCSYQ